MQTIFQSPAKLPIVMAKLVMAIWYGSSKAIVIGTDKQTEVPSLQEGGSVSDQCGSTTPRYFL